LFKHKYVVSEPVQVSTARGMHALCSRVRLEGARLADLMEIL
jgi:hypothetical protein